MSRRERLCGGGRHPDGVVHVRRVDYAKNEPEIILTKSEMQVTFRRLVGEFCPESKTVRLI